MNPRMTLLVCALSLSAIGAARPAFGQKPASSTQPTGTVVTKKHADNNEVQPARKQVGLSSDLIRSAQEKLNEKGYNAGAPSGTMNAKTRHAIRLFQQSEKLPVTGRLDESTLSHLNIGGTSTFGAAPSDVGRGGKAAGHDIAQGHPIAATKAIGTGIGRFGKKVGEGTKSTAVGTKDKVTKSDDAAKEPK
jgi:peptidoglycan hydrolase-like protein with peptidoglycan-binding domain